MFRHGNRLTSILAGIAGVAASGLLVAAPAGASEVQQQDLVPLPSILECATQWTNIIIGTQQDDDIRGTDANDLIIGLGGDDDIYGGAGRDTILGGNGDDVLEGAQGDDCIIGGLGDDDSVQRYFLPDGNDDSYSVRMNYQY